MSSVHVHTVSLTRNVLNTNCIIIDGHPNELKKYLGTSLLLQVMQFCSRKIRIVTISKSPYLMKYTLQPTGQSLSIAKPDTALVATVNQLIFTHGIWTPVLSIDFTKFIRMSFTSLYYLLYFQLCICDRACVPAKIDHVSAIKLTIFTVFAVS